MPAVIRNIPSDRHSIVHPPSSLSDTDWYRYWKDLGDSVRSLDTRSNFPVNGYTGTAAQAAIDRALAGGGGNVVLAAGTHDWSDRQPVLDLSAMTGLLGNARINIIGSGASSCQVNCFVNNSTALTVIGGSFASGGANLAMRIGGFTLNGGNQSKTLNRFGIAITSVIQLEFFDLVVMQFERALTMIDTVVTRFMSCMFQFNSYGIYGEMASQSPPNEMTFVGTHFANCYEYGIWLKQGNNISFIGGSFENSGYNGTDPDRWGIRITNGGFNGPHILGLYGTHFEGTTGTASIWVDHGAYPGVYNLDADFIRNGALFATNEIRVDTTGAANAIVNVRAGFWGVNGYTPSAARRYIAEGTVSGSKHRINFLGSIFDNTTEMPSIADRSLEPPVTNLTNIGSSTNAFRDLYVGTLRMTGGTGTPEGVVTAGIGAIYFRDNGGAGTYVYRKNSGVGNTGWVGIL